MSFLEFVEGPLWYFAATVFVLGALWKVVGILRLGRKKDLSIPRASAAGGAVKSQFLHFIPHGGFTFRTLYHLTAGYIFHIGLFVLLLFAAPHVAFMQNNIIAIEWPTIPYWGFVVAAQFAFAGLILLWVRRISDPVMIKISDKDDHIGSWLTFLVMLTGCMALQESVDALRATHMLLVDLWLIYFPFSRLMHAFTFAFSRGYTGAFFGRRGIVP
ncbi:respiratory nitrate reductase subunit gamma [Magnetovibrio sp.]|uniref:respiratory nitrate reductase subunit gamma n=1 Tax=Magnetovibrio sp. TaxID=2024836 RepID=UPI002F950A4E